MNAQMVFRGGRLLLLLMLAVMCFGCASRLNISVDVRNKATGEPINHAVVAIDTAIVGFNRQHSLERTDETGTATSTFYTSYETFLVYVYVQEHDRHDLFIKPGNTSDVKTALLGPVTLDIKVQVIKD